MSRLRAIAFNLVFYLWTIVLVPPALVMALHRPSIRRMSVFWSRSCLRIARAIGGLQWRVEGRAEVPREAVIIAAKHQSAWDIFGLLSLFPEAMFVVKQELSSIPLFGWMLIRAGHIAVDRAGGPAAMRQMLTTARQRTQAGHVLIVFPQGTRTAPGARAPYLPGIAALYRGLNLAVVPVALNSGVYWPRRRLSLHPGCVRVEFLPPIPPGMDRRAFMAAMESQIEAATDRLVDQATGVQTNFHT